MKRPDVLEGQTYKKTSPCGNCYITINKADDYNEVFISLGKSGTCGRAMLEALGRVISLAMKNKTTRKEIIRTLKGISCRDANDETASCITQVALCLEESDGSKSTDAQT